MLEILKLLEKLNLDYYIEINKTIIKINKKESIFDILNNNLVGKINNNFNNINSIKNNKYKFINIELNKITTIYIEKEDELLKYILFRKVFDSNGVEQDLIIFNKEIFSLKELSNVVLTSIIKNIKSINLEISHKNMIFSNNKIETDRRFLNISPLLSENCFISNNIFILENYKYKNKGVRSNIEKIYIPFYAINSIRYAGVEIIFQNIFFEEKSNNELLFLNSFSRFKFEIL